MGATTYFARDIAKWFLANIDRDAGESITHLKLQKLVYYAQAWSLALRDRPLFNEDIQAWTHGPVAESVFHDYKDYGWNAIPYPDELPDICSEDAEHLQDILDAYGECSAKHLENLTHSEEPWVKARGALPPEAKSCTPISKEGMAFFYKKLWSERGNVKE